MATLESYASVLRSKNAGPFYTTIDVFFDDPEVFEKIRTGDYLTAEAVASAYGLAEEEVYGIYWEEHAFGVKVTIRKRLPTDSTASTDIMGAHQHLPLAALEIPELRVGT